LFREGKEPQHLEFPDLEQLVTALRALRNDKRLAEHTRVYVFRGSRLYTTEPPFVYLIDPEQPPVPLFDQPVPGKVCDGGSLIGEEKPSGQHTDYELATERALAEDLKHLADQQDEPLETEDES
jgi:hypothetical protein